MKTGRLPSTTSGVSPRGARRGGGRHSARRGRRSGLLLALVVLVATAFVLCLAPVAQADIAPVIYVRAGASGTGASWDDACDLQTALGGATAGQEIWVAAGIHYPSTSGDRSASFALKDGVEVYGGFPATGDPGMVDRNWLVNPTILSGDIGTVGNNADNSYTVACADGSVSSSAVLDGFLISRGNNSNTNGHGAGMVCEGSPTLVDLSFDENVVSGPAVYYSGASLPAGGAMDISGSPSLTRVTFSNNEVVYDGFGGAVHSTGTPSFYECTFNNNHAGGSGTGSGHGGAYYQRDGGAVTMENVTFLANHGEYYGGAIWYGGPGLTIKNAKFIDNVTYTRGGAIYVYNGPVSVVNGLFHGNTVYMGSGGGICTEWGTAAVTNSTFSGNQARFDGVAVYNVSGSSTVTNCILWDDIADVGSATGKEISTRTTAAYSDVQGSGGSGAWVSAGVDGGHNLDVKPAFVDPASVDYHLVAGSPLKSAGNSAAPGLAGVTEDLDGMDRVMGLGVEMGPYELFSPQYRSLKGTDRYFTALRLSQVAFRTALPDGSGVVIAPGTTFAEALCGAPLAAAYGGPVLLTPTTGLHPNVRTELQRLAPDYVFVIGLSTTIRSNVQTALPGATVTSIGTTGGNIYTMSHNVAKALGARVDATGGDISDAVGLVTIGTKFADALCLGPLACVQKWPIILTDQAGYGTPLHAQAIATLTDLGIDEMIKVGTYSAAPAGVTSIVNLSGSVPPGVNSALARYYTSANVAEWGVANADLYFGHTAITTGDKFPDALASGPYLMEDLGILLVSPLAGPVPQVIQDTLTAHREEVGIVSFIACIEPVIGTVKGLLP